MKRLATKFIIVALVLLFVTCILETILCESKLPLENVIKIEVTNSYGGGWQGTGIFIKDDLILTAGHMVDDANEVTIVWQNGKEHKAVSWYRESEADLGFIYIRTVEKEGTVDFAQAKLGETVWAFGNPFGVFPVLTKGIVSAIDMHDDYWHQKDMLITDSAINPGNSGSALFNENGKILGICSWGYIGSQGMNYFCRAEICELSLAKYEATRKLAEIN